jgi:hypothetical protein
MKDTKREISVLVEISIDNWASRVLQGEFYLNERIRDIVGDAYQAGVEDGQIILAKKLKNLLTDEESVVE